MTMPLHPTWQEIALRLLLTVVAGALIGFNRGAHGHAAGLRTTMLVGLAASVSMIQANVLLSIEGRASDSFVVLDLMRLPLGVLTGVGFIGGGAILKRGDLVTGVTTAATLWMMTMIGLCLGGGQLIVGSVATLLAFATLWALGWLELRIPRESRGLLVLESGVTAATVEAEVANLIAPMGFRTRFVRQSRCAGRVGESQFAFEVHWKRPAIASTPLEVPKVVGERYSVVSFEISPEGYR